ncbi:hypothetical protein C8R43DRAFT_946828 [Mycena crocata]|nr:hypothetical protein C8R43DRAFT_946828 [Mycena crocata]
MHQECSPRRSKGEEEGLLAVCGFGLPGTGCRCFTTRRSGQRVPQAHVHPSVGIIKAAGCLPVPASCDVAKADVVPTVRCFRHGRALLVSRPSSTLCTVRWVKQLREGTAPYWLFSVAGALGLFGSWGLLCSSVAAGDEEENLAAIPSA